jgi:heme exporter protein A
MRLTLTNVACTRGGRRLFHGIDRSVAAGEALVVTGRNGSGKTSLLRIIAGLLRPEAGSVALEGAETVAQSTHLIGHLDAVKASLTVAENLAFVRDLFGGGDGIAGALERLGLTDLAEIPARLLSAGQRRRLALARLAVAKRPLWLLDEPATALDAEGQDALMRLVQSHLAGGGLLVAATHAPLVFPRSQALRLEGGA